MNVASQRAACEAGPGDEVEDDDQDRPRGAEHQEAPRRRDAVIEVGVAVKDGVVDVLNATTKHMDS